MLVLQTRTSDRCETKIEVRVADGYARFVGWLRGSRSAYPRPSRRQDYSSVISSPRTSCSRRGIWSRLPSTMSVPRGLALRTKDRLEGAPVPLPLPAMRRIISAAGYSVRASPPEPGTLPGDLFGAFVRRLLRHRQEGGALVRDAEDAEDVAGG